MVAPDVLDLMVTLVIQEETMSNSEARKISAIRDYRSDINEPDPRWPDIEFKRASHSRWAVDEILKKIITDTDKTVMQNVVEFKNQMLDYSSKTSMYHEDIQFIFDIAYEVAIDIEDIICAMD